MSSGQRRLADCFHALLQDRFRRLCVQCHEIYKAGGNLIGDLMALPHVNHDFVAFLLDHFKLSLVRALVAEGLRQLVDLDLGLFRAFMEAAVTHGRLPREALTVLGKPTAQSAANTLVFHAVYTGDPLMASLLVLRFRKRGVLVSLQVLQLVVLALCVDLPNWGYNTYAMRVLLQQEVSPEIKERAVRFMLQTELVPLEANELFVELKEPSEELVEAVMRANLERGNYHFVLERGVPAPLIPLFTTVADPKSIRTVLSEAEDSTDLNALLDFYGHGPGLDKTKFGIFTKKLTPPLLRDTLSVLFSSLLHQSNEIGAEKILQTIFGTFNGLNSRDFESIVVKLLSQGKLKQSMEMCTNGNVQVAKLGYVRVVEYLLTHKDDSKEDFFHEVVRRFHQLEPSDEAKRRLTLVIIKHLSDHASNGAARRLYIKGRIFFPSFGMPKSFNRLILLDSRNRLACVAILFKKAVIDGDADIEAWCREHMLQLGVFPRHIEAYR